MDRGRVDSRGSLEPNDEVMPYSDDETDDELDASSEEEVEEPLGAPQPAADARPSGELSASARRSVFLIHRHFDLFESHFKPPRLTFRDAVEGQSQRPTVSPPARV